MIMIYQARVLDCGQQIALFQIMIVKSDRQQILQSKTHIIQIIALKQQQSNFGKSQPKNPIDTNQQPYHIKQKREHKQIAKQLQATVTKYQVPKQKLQINMQKAKNTKNINRQQKQSQNLGKYQPNYMYENAQLIDSNAHTISSSNSKASQNNANIKNISNNVMPNFDTFNAFTSSNANSYGNISIGFSTPNINPNSTNSSNNLNNIRSKQKNAKQMRKPFETSRNSNISSCTLLPSTYQNRNNLNVPNNFISQRQREETMMPSSPTTINMKVQDIQSLNLAYFAQKYLMNPDTDNYQGIKQQMQMYLNRKRVEIQSLRIYRDQLKFISRNTASQQSLKLSLQTLKQKAETEQKLHELKYKLEKQLNKTDRELQMLSEYNKFMNAVIDMPSNPDNREYMDISKEEEVMVKNLELEKDMLIRQLADQQRRNSIQIRRIQQQILEYRIMIKQKQDNLRNLKARICTLYIKMNNKYNKNSNGRDRYNPNNPSSQATSNSKTKSKDRNMSLSIRKFNTQIHHDIKEAYIGNSTFKNYGKEIIEKVTAEEQLLRIKFFICSTTANITSNNNNNNNNEMNASKTKEQLFFQCFYKGREGIIHDNRSQEIGPSSPNTNNPVNDDDATRDKISQTTQKFQQIYVKYLFSMKFYYKSKIVGVECRIKTDKGNKNIYIGNCNPNIQHELLTLVNKKIVTMGSYWHGKEMIGVSVWYSDKQKLPVESSTYSKNKGLNGDEERKIKARQQTYDQYYS